VQTSGIGSEVYRACLESARSGNRDARCRFDAFRKEQAFHSAAIVELRGDSLTDAAGKPVDNDPALRAAALKAVAGNTVVRTEAARDVPGRLRVDFVVPLPAVEDHRPLVVLRSEAADRLLPLLQTWPVPSASGETVLFRRQGEQVIYLSALRHPPDAQTTLRRSDATTRLAAIAAAPTDFGRGITVAGLDYRHAMVLGVVRAIPDTDWLLLAKVDLSEVYRQAGADAVWIVLAALLALLALMVFAYVAKQREELAAFMRQRQAAAEAAGGEHPSLP
jgi:hypothetical protein